MIRRRIIVGSVVRERLDGSSGMLRCRAKSIQTLSYCGSLPQFLRQLLQFWLDKNDRYLFGRRYRRRWPTQERCLFVVPAGADRPRAHVAACPGSPASGKFKKPRNMESQIPERADPSGVGAARAGARPRQSPKLAELTCPPLPYILHLCIFAPCRPPCVVVHGCRCVGSADTISDTHPATTGWVLF
jgi:hypothetical protein